MKKLIINADDFWMSKIYNREIIDLAKSEKISSISVMTKRWIENQIEDVEELKKVCNWKNISIGLHLEFKGKEDNYLNNIEDQMQKFIGVFWFSPNHLDVHKESPEGKCTNEIVEKANNLNITFRNRSDQRLANKHTDWERYVASKKTIQEVETWLWSLEDNKSYEIVFHPWKYDSESSSSLNKEREDDVKMILHINELKEKMNIEIVSFKDL